MNRIHANRFFHCFPCLTATLAIATGLCLLLPGMIAAQQKQPAAKDAPAPQWKDLFDGKTLEGWTATKFGGEGKVYVKDGAIVMDIGNDMTGVTWKGKPPRDNFEISLEGKRLDGHDFFCTTTFPVGDEYCSVVMGGWGGTIVGLSNVDSNDASENATTKYKEFKDKEWYTLRIRVTTDKIEAWINDKQVIDQDRKDHKFGIRPEVEPNRPLGIATWQTQGRSAKHPAAGIEVIASRRRFTSGV